jgi:hypothetical protein
VALQMIDFHAREAAELEAAEAEIKQAEDALLLADAALSLERREAWRGVREADPTVIRRRHHAVRRLENARALVAQLNRWNSAPAWKPSSRWQLTFSQSGRPRHELRRGKHVARLALRYAFPGAPGRYTFDIDGRTQALGFETEAEAQRAAERLLAEAAR